MTGRQHLVLHARTGLFIALRCAALRGGAIGSLAPEMISTFSLEFPAAFLEQQAAMENRSLKRYGPGGLG